MKSIKHNEQSIKESEKYASISTLLYYTGYKYWPFSILPALVGTILPFWLNEGFSLKWLQTIEYFFMVVLFHSGFSMLQYGFDKAMKSGLQQSRLLLIGSILLIVMVVLVIHLNSHLQLNTGVNKNIFLIFAAGSLFLGLLYVMPPLKLYKHALGEYIYIVGFGMMPVLGAYLIQVGDLHRTVYLASFPLVFSIGLYVWVSKLINRSKDIKEGNTTLVTLFPAQFASRYITLLLLIGIYASIVMAVIGRSSLSPFSMIAFVSIGLSYKVLLILWKGYEKENTPLNVQSYTFRIYLVVSVSIVISSLSGLFEL